MTEENLLKMGLIAIVESIHLKNGLVNVKSRK